MASSRRSQRSESARRSSGMRKFKMVLLGEAGVGKSCLLFQLAEKTFLANSNTTIGAAFCTHIMHLEGETIKLEIWDTAGQERYRSLAPMYYRGAQAALVVYDITAEDSFVRAKDWIRELQIHSDQNLIIALAGSKADLADNRKVQFEEAQQFAEENGLLFKETSAKTALNVNEIFMEIAMKLPLKESLPPAGNRRGIRLDDGEQDSRNKSKGCCS